MCLNEGLGLGGPSLVQGLGVPNRRDGIPGSEVKAADKRIRSYHPNLQTLPGPAILVLYRDLKGPFKGDTDTEVDVEVGVDIDRYFGLLQEASKSVQVLLTGIESVGTDFVNSEIASPVYGGSAFKCHFTGSHSSICWQLVRSAQYMRLPVKS